MSKKRKSKSKNTESGKHTNPRSTVPTPESPTAAKKQKKDKPQVSGGVFFAAVVAFIAVAGIAGFLILGPGNDSDGSNSRISSGSSISKNGSTNPISKASNDKKTWEEIDDPESDGWKTELFTDHANDQLKQLGKLLTGESDANPAKLESLIGQNFSCGSLLPDGLNTVFEDQQVVVERSAQDPPGNLFGRSLGQAGFVEALAAFRIPFEKAKDLRFKFKLFRVNPVDGSDEIETIQYLGISGRTEQGMLEQNSTWTIRWETTGQQYSSQTPLIKSIDVSSFEQVRTSDPEGPLFTDATESALEQNASYGEQLLHGYNYWLDRTETRPYWARLGTPGLAVGDVNGDGLEDIYVCQERGLPNLLFIQNPDGSVLDISKQAGVDWLEDCRGVLIIDLDNDGDQDLAVGVTGGLVLAENDGSANFKIRRVLPISDDVKSLCAADYDNDGKLDIYVTAYYANVFDGGKVEKTDVAAARTNQAVYDVNNGGANTLYRNEGDWAFTNVTSEVGLDVNNARYSLAATWEDFDNDGDQDLYVPSDYGLNCLYRNDAGQFSEVAIEAQVEDNSFAMSAAWADYNRDGFMDLHVGNMFSAAGNRITYQQMFKPGVTDEERAKFQHLARGNTLFKNNGDGSFDDVTLDSAVNIGRWTWSANFIDLNNDGWQDLIVANGMITTEDTGDC